MAWGRLVILPVREVRAVVPVQLGWDVRVAAADSQGARFDVLRHGHRVRRRPEKRVGRPAARGPARDNAPRNANIRLLPQPRAVGEVSDHDLDAAAPVFVMGPGVLKLAFHTLLTIKTGFKEHRREWLF